MLIAKNKFKIIHILITIAYSIKFLIKNAERILLDLQIIG